MLKFSKGSGAMLPQAVLWLYLLLTQPNKICRLAVYRTRHSRNRRLRNPLQARERNTKALAENRREPLSIFGSISWIKGMQRRGQLHRVEHSYWERVHEIYSRFWLSNLNDSWSVEIEIHTIHTIWSYIKKSWQHRHTWWWLHITLILKWDVGSLSSHLCMSGHVYSLNHKFPEQRDSSQ